MKSHLIRTITRDFFRNMYYTRRHITPEVFLAGFQKCGTTSLHNYLVATDKFISSEKKEIDALALKDDIGEFLSFFPRTNEKGNRGKTCLCTSHQFCYVPGAAARLKKYYPKAKILLIFRNPTERAFSQYNHYIRTTKNPKHSFEHYLDEEFRIIESYNKEHDIAEIYHKTRDFDTYGRFVSKGLYYIYVQELMEQGFEVYPVFTEEMSSDFFNTFKGVLEYLGVSVDDEKINSLNTKVHNKGGYKSSMEEETRKRLDDFFEPYNQKLFDLLKVEPKW